MMIDLLLFILVVFFFIINILLTSRYAQTKLLYSYSNDTLALWTFISAGIKYECYDYRE